MTTDEWIARARAVHGDRYDYSQTSYINQRTPVTIICKIHGSFTQKADSHIRGCGCRKCGYVSAQCGVSHEWSDEQRAKIAATCMARYGAPRYLDSEAGRAHAARIRRDPAYLDKMHAIISSDAVQAKTKSTCMRKYGVESAMRLPETINKSFATKARNHTFSTSKPEESMYALLCDRFGEDDVVRQYKTERYPFRCDFYIASLDLFIELNASWTYGGGWFDPADESCFAQLRRWQEKVNGGHPAYAAAIDVWTVRDVAKRNTAIANQLNYLAFWKTDLSDFTAWLDSDVLSLNNILDRY